MKKSRITLFVLMFALFAGSISMMIRQAIHTRTGADVYRDMMDLAGVSAVSAPEDQRPYLPLSAPAPTEAAQPARKEFAITDPRAANLALIDLPALQAVNPDIIGWLHIPGTNISYPLLQGEDNQHYLKHTWDNQQNVVGSIFMECTNSPDLTNFNTIIYGHNLEDGTMLTQLHSYQSQAFWAQFPHIYVVTGNGIYRYEVFSAAEVSITDICYRLSFPDDASKQHFLDAASNWSILDTGIVPTPEDRVLTLSTCTGVIYTNRLVIQARLEGLVVAPETPQADSIQTLSATNK